MTRSTDILLREILRAISLIQEYTEGLSFEGFLEEVEKQDAVVRRLEIIGEVVKNLPQDLRAKYPDVQWREIAGVRDLLIHEYFRVDLRLLWGMVRDDIPKLAVEIEAVLEGQE